jgi:hypothetical protein
VTAATLRRAYRLNKHGEMPSNPPSTPTFSRATTVALIVGALLAFLELDRPGFSAFGVAAVLALAAFVALFARDWLVWLVRGSL